MILRSFVNSIPDL